MEEIGLPEAIAEVRAGLLAAMEQGADQDLQFPIESVELQFQVGVTREKSGSGGLKVWVVEFEGGAGVTREDVHTVTVTFGSPVDQDGEPVKVRRRRREKP
ncbi:hypothetical protein GCM10009733_007130 [Nonomuraea maheshkhaliensis]|uniref:Trypsin-co-occurring domain-containing protein n=1 Tax=Nonomuraea maheshkhaliensis TaxID=419590 RepID=A0ABN2EPB0_9ACTN